MRMRFLFVLLFCFALAAAAALAQTSTGSLTGTVRDDTGGVIPGATVTATRAATGATRTVVTSDSGIYRVLNISPGNYTIRVEMTGFKTAVDENVEVTIGELRRVDITLSIGDISEEVIVQSQAALLQKEEGRMSQLVESAEIQDLPLNGRNAFQLAQLGPGIYPTMGVTAQDDGGNAGDSFITNGQRHRANNFLIDGTDNNYVGIAGVPSVNPQVDMIEEFRVHTNNFSAEYGRNAGAIVNVLTKSGTNTLHGTVYEYHRNDVFDAREFFDDACTPKRPDCGEPPPLIQHTYGFTIGGPIIKDKLFAFGGYEGFRETAAESSTFQVESQEMLNWLRTNRPNSIALQLFDRFPLAGGAPSDPNFDPNDIEPLEVSKGTPAKTIYDQFNIRFDYTINDNDKFYVRYTDNEDSGPPTIVRASVDSVGAVEEKASTFSETHVFSPTVVNEFRVGWNMRKPNFDVQEGTFDVPTITITGFSPDFGAASNIPQFFSRHTYQLSDQLSWSRGDHSFKFGGEFRQGQENSDFQANTRGQYNFGDITEFLNDAPFQQSNLIDPVSGTPIGTPRHFRVNEWALYVQDDWKIKPNLTVNIGLRYENFRPPWEGDSIQSNVVLGSGNDLFERLANSSIQVFPDGKDIYEPDNNNFAPRLGFAWDPTGEGVWAIRGGYGISYNRIFMNITSNIKFNPPFAKSVTARGTALPIVYSIPTTIPTEFVNSAAGRFNPNILDPDLATTYVHSIFFGVQREVFSDWMLEANYVSTLGRKLYAQEHYNRFTGDGCEAGVCNTGNLDGFNQAWGVGLDDFLTASINQAYHGGQFSAQKRFTKGLAFRANYTWAKNIDDDTDVFGTTADDSGASVIENRKLDRALSSIHVANRFAANWVWDIPYLKTSDNWAVRNVLAGWQFNGLIALQDGSPANINADGNNCGQTTGGVIRGDFNCDGVTDDRPNDPGSFDLNSVNPKDARLGTSIFAPFSPTSNARLAFPRPVLGTIGNLGRNTFRYQGFSSVDVSLFKNVRIPWFKGETANWQLRWEVFNLFNRVNTRPWEENIASGNFGRTFSAQDAREMQFALKFIF